MVKTLYTLYCDKCQRYRVEENMENLVSVAIQQGWKINLAENSHVCRRCSEEEKYWK